MEMMNTRFDTLSIVQLRLQALPGDVGTIADSKKLAPTQITQASKKPLRIVLDNISAGGAEVWFAFDAATLQTNEPGGNTFMLQAGKQLTTMLAPEQRLYAISLSEGAKISLVISEALPADKT